MEKSNENSIVQYVYGRDSFNFFENEDLIEELSENDDQISMGTSDDLINEDYERNSIQLVYGNKSFTFCAEEDFVEYAGLIF